MCVTALLLVAASQLIRNLRTPSRQGAFGLGVLLGALYLAKAAQFLLDGVVVGTMFLFYVYTHGRRATALCAALAAGLALVAVPWIAVLSLHYGRVTFSDSPKIATLWRIAGKEGLVHPQSVPFGVGRLVHPTRKIFTAPDVFEFATPIAATYPPGRDPAYWLDGLSVQLPLRMSLYVFYWNMYGYTKLFLESYPVLTVGLVLLALLAGSCRPGQPALRSGLIGAAPLLLWSVAAFLMYAAVVVEYRYLSGALIILCVTVIAVGLRTITDSPRRQLVAHVSVAVVGLGLVVPELVNIYGQARRIVEECTGRSVPFHRDLAIARAVESAGVPVRSRIATIGYSATHYFARLGRLHIAAEVIDPEVTKFWRMAPVERELLYSNLRSYDVTAVVTATAPENSVNAGWIPLAGTPYWLLLLKK